MPDDTPIPPEDAPTEVSAPPPEPDPGSRRDPAPEADPPAASPDPAAPAAGPDVLAAEVRAELAEPEPEPEPIVPAPLAAPLPAGRLADMVEADRRWMDEALAMAAKGLAIGELPIGAVVVADGEVIGRAFTQEATQGRLLVHAELLALDQADRVVGGRRGRAVLYTTLEPCLMCLGAAATAMVERVVFALDSATDGARELASLWDAHRHARDLPSVYLPPVHGGVGTEASRALFARFIATRPGPTDPLALWAATLVTPAAPAADPPAAG
ncbi:nucleoside deaminase [Aquihabitans sp. G128]|uniref:nucleoside deaminase n=1 Tax=Aquihabitans sp. G128 TaxID=2849779 RepID=UPI001C22D5CD|nr:nucleoside deaminase [Aquihabitans sp. G128]QXC59508.1 nucleoside deaminase [Aquihabitans sp. G128]